MKKFMNREPNIIKEDILTNLELRKNIISLNEIKPVEIPLNSINSEYIGSDFYNIMSLLGPYIKLMINTNNITKETLLELKDTGKLTQYDYDKLIYYVK